MVLREFTDLSTWLDAPATQAALAAARTGVQFSRETGDGLLSRGEFALMMNRTMHELWPEIIRDVDDHTLAALIDFVFCRVSGGEPEDVAGFDELVKSMAVALVAEGISDAIIAARHDSVWGADISGTIIAHRSWTSALAAARAEQELKYRRKPGVLLYLKTVFNELEARFRSEAYSAEVEQKLSAFDMDASTGLSRAEFRAVIMPFLAEKGTMQLYGIPDDVNDLVVRQIFKHFDVDNSGELEHCDMRNLLATIELKGVLVELPSMINRWLQIGSAGGSARPHPLPPTPPGLLQ